MKSEYRWGGMDRTVLRYPAAAMSVWRQKLAALASCATSAMCYKQTFSFVHFQMLNYAAMAIR